MDRVGSQQSFRVVASTGSRPTALSCEKLSYTQAAVRAVDAGRVWLPYESGLSIYSTRGSVERWDL